MKIKDLFDLIQGHQITDEEIYQDIINKGKIPIITASNEIKGFWNKALVDETQLPCITYPTKANFGVCYVQKSVFDANNTAVLIPKKIWKNDLCLEWIAFKLSRLFLSIPTSKEGVNYLNKEIVEELELKLIPKPEQKKQFELISKILETKDKVLKLIAEIENIKLSTLSINYKNFQAKNISAKIIFDCVNGNSGLTEEVIYQNIDLKNKKPKYDVLSSSTIGRTRLGEIPICTITGQNKSIRVFENLEGLLVIRNGKAGKLYFLKPNNYTLNDHAYILFLKIDFPYKLNLRWLMYQYQELFFGFSSLSDNGTWNKSGFFDHAEFDIPSIEEQENVLKRFEELEMFEEKLALILQKIEEILNKDIVMIKN